MSVNVFITKIYLIVKEVHKNQIFGVISKYLYFPTTHRVFIGNNYSKENSVAFINNERFAIGPRTEDIYLFFRVVD